VFGGILTLSRVIGAVVEAGQDITVGLALADVVVRVAARETALLRAQTRGDDVFGRAGGRGLGHDARGSEDGGGGCEEELHLDFL
jgi:hypothetical protein